jgi:uncharacterized delta-60 repeat protein
MRTVKILLGIVILVLVGFMLATLIQVPVPAARPGSLDTSFHAPDGFVLFNGAAGSKDRGVEVAVQDDGKIVVLGYSNNSRNEDLLLTRYTAGGDLDRGFGTNGTVLYDGGGNDRGLGLALQPDGKILATGYTYAGKQRDVLLLRYEQNGTLDPSFGNGGVVMYSSAGNATDIGFGIAMQADSGIIVVGETASLTSQDALVLRYTPAGIPDARFGTGGVATYGGAGMDRAFAVAVEPDGKIVVTGSTVRDAKDDVLLFRLNAGGMRDTAFGNGGAVTFSGIGDNPDYGNCVSLQDDGKIVVSGAVSNAGAYDVLLLRYNPDGTPDTAFGTGGAAFSGGAGDDYGYAHVVQADKKIVVTGFTGTGTSNDVLLLRFDPSGQPDTGFGTSGRVTWSSTGNTMDYGQGLALQPDGKIVVTGFSTTPTGEDMLLMRFMP